MAYLNARKEFASDEGKMKIDEIKISLLFSDLRMEKFNDNENLIIVPLKEGFETRNKVRGKSFKNLVVIEDSKGNYRKGDMVEFIPKDNTLKTIPKNYFADVYNNKKGLIADGVTSILTLTDRNIIDLTYNNGSLEKYRYASPMVNGKLLYKNNSQEVVNQCINWFWEYYVNGVLVYEEYAFTTCSGDCQETFGKWKGNDNGGGIFIIGCGGGGGGSGYLPETLLTIDSVAVNLSDTCFINLVSQITNTKIKTEITKMFLRTFIGFGHSANILFMEDNTLVNTDNSPRASSSSVQNGVWTIRLNPIYGSSNVSKEFWASVVIHELVHGFIAIYKSQGPPLTQYQSHEFMFQNTIDQMSEFLTENFGLSQVNANALALGGLDQVLTRENANGDIVFKQQYDAMAQSRYGISLQDALVIRENYKSGSSGTICN